MEPTRILIVEADGRSASSLRAQLRGLGYAAESASSAAEASALAARLKPDLVLLDLAAPGCGEKDFLRGLRTLGDSSVVVVGEAEPGPAVLAALAAGADRHLPRPIDEAQLRLAVQRAGESRALRAEIEELRDQVRGRLELIASSAELVSVFELVRRVAPTKATVLVQGESGAGKNHLAQVIHELSPRRERPFVAVNCAALGEPLVDALLFGPEPGAFEEPPRRRSGRIEEADRGTLYLHEVGRLPPAVQVKLLRVLQEGVFERPGGRGLGRVDVRLVAGTSRDLAEEVRHGRFRDDLYYRLNVVSAALPPLRDRKADIPSLVAHLLAERARATRTPPLVATPGVLSAFFAYPWPGNLRELAAVVDAAAAHAPGAELRVEDLPPVLRSGSSEERSASGLIPGATLFEIEREAILRTLEQEGGSTARAAEVLGVSARKIQYRLKEYRAGQPGRRPPPSLAFGDPYPR
jgi:two-component system NtrC family response regulator